MRRSLDFFSSVRTQSMSRLRLTSVPLRKSLKPSIGSLGYTRHWPTDRADTGSATLMAMPTSSFCRS